MEKELKLIKITSDVVIFEEGWWMDRKDYDFGNSKDEDGIPIHFKDLGWDRDKKTHKLTYFFIPN
jgi:hypothetical protein